MSIKSKRTITRIFATFLILSLTLCYFTISSSASDYSDLNDTVYWSADYYALEELPYGEDTGVIQFWYGSDKYLTFYFDKLSIYESYNRTDIDMGVDKLPTYAKDHYWQVFWDSSSGVYDYRLNIVSDSPIYYTTSYDTSLHSGGISKTVYVPLYGLEDGSTVASQSQSYDVYEYKDLMLSEIVNWTILGNENNRSVVSNCCQYRITSGRYSVYPALGTSFTNMRHGSQVGYDISYYPTLEYLQNINIRDILLNQFDVMKEQLEYIQYIYGDMWTVNYYLDCILNADLSILTNVETYLPLMETRLLDIYNVLLEIKSGPEYDSSQGIGSNTEFGDTAGGLMQDTEVPSIGTDSIQSNLGSSFLFIRNMFDWVTGNFNLVYIISFLLGLSFIAYVLGRVIKNKMNG